MLDVQVKLIRSPLKSMFSVVALSLKGGLFPFGHATSDRLFLSFFFERIRQAGAGTLFRDVFAGIDQMPKWNEKRKSQNWVGERSNY